MTRQYVAINSSGSYWAGSGRGVSSLDEATRDIDRDVLQRQIEISYLSRNLKVPKMKIVPVNVRITLAK